MAQLIIGTRGSALALAQSKMVKARLEALAPDLLGANCRGPYDVLETLQILAGVSSLPLYARPNAGSPEIDRGRVVYNVDSIQFGHYARRLVEAGACMVGGCCGTDPGHIAQVAESVRDLKPPPPR
ncbi:MAG TPA: homocysteine S-methyltransferase family protein, partial [Elusimicrobiota bacterium]|nr:homocysteine S-methyltransferase family protein [Elusimicrobiota bacterium]